MLTFFEGNRGVKNRWENDGNRPDWRMYYVQHGAVLILMRGGGDKSSQASDIAAAKKLAATLVFKE